MNGGVGSYIGVLVGAAFSEPAELDDLRRISEGLRDLLSANFRLSSLRKSGAGNVFCGLDALNEDTAAMVGTIWLESAGGDRPLSEST